MPLEEEGMSWDSKQGWLVPRLVLDARPYLIGFFCRTTVLRKEHESTYYLVHSTGTTAPTLPSTLYLEHST